MAIGEDFNPLTVPKVMDQTVRRIDEQGYPKQALLDYEQALQQWMKDNTANTNTRLTLVSDEVDGAYAAISTEAITRASADEALASLITTVEANVADNAAAIVTETTARVNADNAIATQITTLNTNIGNVNSSLATEITTRASADTALANSITTVDAKANNATANGQVYLAAVAAPGGATAAYGWHLTAGSSYAGMEAIALSGGGSAIGFTASAMYFTDSGTAQQVLTYNGSAFVFGVPIIIRSGTSGARTVITNQLIEVYDSSNVLRVRLGLW